MKEFSDDEKTIARNINEGYEWMARDKSGSLFVYQYKPTKRETGIWDVPSDYFTCIDNTFKRGLFSSIKWEDDEPTRIRDIYDPQILDDVERKYLKTVLRPFHKKVNYIKKYGRNIRKDGTYANEYLFIAFQGGYFTFPDFDKGKMYAGMEMDKKYKLDDLGITYTDGCKEFEV